MRKLIFFLGILRPVPKFDVLRKYCFRRRTQNVRVTFRVKGWCMAKVMWCTGSGSLVYKQEIYFLIKINVFGSIFNI